MAIVEVTRNQEESDTVIERELRQNRPSGGVGTGVAAGVAGAGASLLGALTCSPDEHAEGPCWGFFRAMLFAGAPATAGAIAWRQGRTAWKRISADELRSELAARQFQAGTID